MSSVGGTSHPADSTKVGQPGTPVKDPTGKPSEIQGKTSTAAQGDPAKLTGLTGAKIAGSSKRPPLRKGGTVKKGLGTKSGQTPAGTLQGAQRQQEVDETQAEQTPATQASSSESSDQFGFNSVSPEEIKALRVGLARDAGITSAAEMKEVLSDIKVMVTELEKLSSGNEKLRQINNRLQEFEKEITAIQESKDDKELAKLNDILWKMWDDVENIQSQLELLQIKDVVLSLKIEDMKEKLNEIEPNAYQSGTVFGKDQKESREARKKRAEEASEKFTRAKAEGKGRATEKKQEKTVTFDLLVEESSSTSHSSRQKLPDKYEEVPSGKIPEGFDPNSKFTLGRFEYAKRTEDGEWFEHFSRSSEWEKPPKGSLKMVIEARLNSGLAEDQEAVKLRAVLKELAGEQSSD